MTSAFTLARHGFRSPNTTTPQLTLVLGPTVSPSVVEIPSYGGSYTGTLLNRTLSHTLPNITKAVKCLIQKTTKCLSEKSSKKLQVETYADTSVSRCQQTAVGWAAYLNSKLVCGVPTTPEVPVDPRVNHHAAEQNLDVDRWIAAQKEAAALYKEQAQRQWRALLELLGFVLVEVSTDSDVNLPPPPAMELNDETPGGGRERALFFLGLPPNTFDFGTAVVMAFGLPGKTAAEILKQAHWPTPREKKNQRKWLEAAADLLSTVLATWYPFGYVADTMSAPVSRLALSWLQEREGLLVAVSHEEHINFFRAALGLGLFYYPLPTSCLLLVREKEGSSLYLKVYTVKNKIKKCGAVSKEVVVQRLPDITLETLSRLAAIEIKPIPDFVCESTYGHGCPC